MLLQRFIRTLMGVLSNICMLSLSIANKENLLINVFIQI